ncbi:ABC transporter permease [Aurantiacibacter sp. D1-12]|uniref:ABC transporter permease n=1 Tax=Aurantiacibacter sp. D1-12 TaxID=2993658 RepID=UPI00237C8003|nr:ABC transporter permease [Aurantiacibacter sp. D1-12]MDE1468522.1 ABC transporter permease [Aurantiacibacter sp. D1-12]
MREILLVAKREMRQVIATKGFWIMLAAVPIALAISGFASNQLAPERTTAYSVVDESGRYAPLLETQMQASFRQATLRELSEYAEKWELQHVDPEAPWANRQAWLNPAEIQRFAEAGGAEAAVALLEPELDEDTPPFEIEDPYYTEVALPDGVAIPAVGEEVGERLRSVLEDDITVDDRRLPYGAILHIPANFGQPGAQARIFTNGRSNASLIRNMREILSASVRQDAFAAQGIAPDTAIALQTMQAPVSVIEPPPGEGRSLVATRSLVPIALVYLLLITAVTTGSMMLQGVVEERSNKLFESVLACIKPDTLMQGKLLGLGAIGLIIVLTWAGTGLVAALYFEGFAAEVLRPSLEALDDPLLILAMIIYFLGGYVVLAMVFLAVGAISESMQDAQSYLTPVIFLIMIPVVIVMQAALKGPDEPVALILSWIPLYTPFAMLARLGSGVATWEIIGTIVLLIAFIWLELKLLGNIFRASLLNDGKPTWKRIFSWMGSKDSAG